MQILSKITTQLLVSEAARRWRWVSFKYKAYLKKKLTGRYLNAVFIYFNRAVVGYLMNRDNLVHVGRILLKILEVLIFN